MNVPGVIRLVQPPVEALPYPPVARALLRAIEGALVEAWRRIRSNPTLNLAAMSTAHEDVFTGAMIDELGRLLTEGYEGFRDDFFSTPLKSPELDNRDGTSLCKRPDIFVPLREVPRVVQQPRYYAVLVEAKIIDGRSQKTAVKYRSDGIQRFLDGDYAWKMREGMLCAYVLDGSKVMAVLPTPPGASPAVTDLVLRLGTTSTYAELADSTHPRSWTYASPNAGSPGPISLSHVWLRP